MFPELPQNDKGYYIIETNNELPFVCSKRGYYHLLYVLALRQIDKLYGKCEKVGDEHLFRASVDNEKLANCLSFGRDIGKFESVKDTFKEACPEFSPNLGDYQTTHSNKVADEIKRAFYGEFDFPVDEDVVNTLSAYGVLYALVCLWKPLTDKLGIAFAYPNMDFQALEEMGRAFGVDAMVDAYFDGVAVSDILGES